MHSKKNNNGRSKKKNYINIYYINMYVLQELYVLSVYIYVLQKLRFICAIFVLQELCFVCVYLCSTKVTFCLWYICSTRAMCFVWIFSSHLILWFKQIFWNCNPQEFLAFQGKFSELKILKELTLIFRTMPKRMSLTWEHSSTCPSWKRPI